MEKKIEQLLETLEKTRCIYQDLLGVVQNERSAVLNSNMNDLTNILVEKENMLAQLAVLETRRTHQLSQIAGQLRLPVQQLTLSVLAQHAPVHYADKIHHQRMALRQTIATIGKANQESQGLVKHCLNLVQGALHFLRHCIAPPTVYGASGHIDDETKNGNLISGAV